MPLDGWNRRDGVEVLGEGMEEEGVVVMNICHKKL